MQTHVDSSRNEHHIKPATSYTQTNCHLLKEITSRAADFSTVSRNENNLFILGSKVRSSMAYLLSTTNWAILLLDMCSSVWPITT